MPTLIELAILALSLAASLLTAGHALLYKRDSRAALAWIGFCLIVPLFGPSMYFLFGINRIRTRARKLMSRHESSQADAAAHDGSVTSAPDSTLPVAFVQLARVSEALTGRALLGGNAVELLHNGEETYPAMLDAIERARQFLYFSTYIYRSDKSGREFADALARAVSRGVEVRVIVDGVGQMYGLPFASTLLRRCSVPVAAFLPLKLFPPSVHLNLRNHRKLLAIDGQVAFVGGINVSDNHLAGDTSNAGRVVDVHFRLRGPICGQLERVFLEDWAFCSDLPGPTVATPDLRPARWRESDDRQPDAPPLEGHGSDPPASAPALCRVIADGPNEDMGKLTTVLVSAVSAAQRSIRIMTPYLLPPRELIAALQSAALRGLDVSILLPGQTDHRIVQWATRNMLWELLGHGVRVAYQPPPFVHSKMVVIDDVYALVGSSNLDPRSLRLNFELMVEIYGEAAVAPIARHYAAARAASRESSLDEVDGRPLLPRVRDAVAWLFSPYL